MIDNRLARSRTALQGMKTKPENSRARLQESFLRRRMQAKSPRANGRIFGRLFTFSALS
jgi:hypothetical protein